jgi:hypothetical protein
VRGEVRVLRVHDEIRVLDDRIGEVAAAVDAPDEQVRIEERVAELDAEPSADTRVVRQRGMPSVFCSNARPR